MSVARKDDRHNEDLVTEIAASFDRALSQRTSQQQDGAKEGEQPRFVITGDKRANKNQKRP